MQQNFPKLFNAVGGFIQNIGKTPNVRIGVFKGGPLK